MDNTWTIYAFYSNAYIQDMVQIDDNTKIFPLPRTLPLSDQAEFIDWATNFIAKQEGEWVKNSTELKNIESKNTIVCIETKREYSYTNINQVLGAVKSELKYITDLFSFFQKNAIHLFGVLLIHEGKLYPKLITEPHGEVHYIKGGSSLEHIPEGGLSETYQKALAVTVIYPVFKLYFDAYSDALYENDLEFKFFKLYSLLELMSQPFGNEIPYPQGFIPKKDCNGNIISSEKIRAMFEYLNISTILTPPPANASVDYIIKINEPLDLLRVAKQHRNCVGHLGNCTPEYNSNCKKWCNDLCQYNDTMLGVFDHLVHMAIKQWMIIIIQAKTYKA